MSEEIITTGSANRQTCPDCGQILELHRMEYSDGVLAEVLAPLCSVWLACGRCQVAWEATLEVVKLRRIK